MSSDTGPSDIGALRRVLAWLLWPAMIGGALGGVRLAVGRGVAAPLALVVLQLVVVLVVVALERLMPEHPSWNVARGDVRADALHTLVSGVIISAILRTAIFAAVPGLGLWPARAPLALQLALALLVADFGSYATHVLEHKLGWLWPVHAPHHASRRLYWLNTSRMHPLDTGGTLLVSLLPLALLGAPPAVLLMMDAFAIVHLMLQHSNVRLRAGLLSHVVATAEFHRWHHSSERAGGESNYASFLSLWDHLFGTWRMPAAPQPPDAVGLYDGTTMSDRWVDQLLHPLRAWAARGSAPEDGAS